MKHSTIYAIATCLAWIGMVSSVGFGFPYVGLGFVAAGGICFSFCLFNILRKV